MKAALPQGPGRLLVFVYGLFALAATARATVQILSDWSAAPLAYGLSLAAGIIYIVATTALVTAGDIARAVAWCAIAIELVGVIGVGVFSMTRPELFPEATVWSFFGQGYGYVPLVLPIFGLLWLWRTRHAHSPPDRLPITPDNSTEGTAGVPPAI